MAAERPFLAKRVQIPSPEWDATANAVRRAMRLTAELNKLSFDDAAKVRAIFSELTGQKVDETFKLIPPFYTASGLEIRVGRKVFINQCCTIYDMGGVDIPDLVMISVRCQLSMRVSQLSIRVTCRGHVLYGTPKRAVANARFGS